MKPYRTKIKILFALQQDIGTLARNLICGASLQVNMRDRLAKKNFSVYCCIALKNTSYENKFWVGWTV